LTDLSSMRNLDDRILPTGPSTPGIRFPLKPF
jgi:hypothetical protein